MAVPKKRTSRSRRGMRRAHDFDKPANVIRCENCGKPRLSHNICPFCNFYNGRDITVVESSNKA